MLLHDEKGNLLGHVDGPNSPYMVRFDGTVEIIAGRYRAGSMILGDLFSQVKAIVSAYAGSLYVPSDANCFQDSAGTIAGAKDAVVGYLRDITGTKHLTQATAGFKPILRKGTKTGSTSDGVGNWWLDFDGVDDHLTGASAISNAALNHYAAAAATYDDADTSWLIRFVGAGEDALTLLRFSGNNYISWNSFDGVSVNNGLAGSALTQGQAYVLAGGQDASTKKLFKNGALDGSMAATVFPALSTMSLGSAGGSVQLTGKVYAALAMPGMPSTSERSVLDKYLGSLAGVAL